jgi:nucleotidyltransferase/DNA polymerase involved in DNA repair
VLVEAIWGGGDRGLGQYEARAIGVRSAMSMAERGGAARAVVVSPPRSLRRVFRARPQNFERFTPRFEMASGTKPTSTHVTAPVGPPWRRPSAEASVRGETGLPCSIGLATSKVVAKVPRNSQT